MDMILDSMLVKPEMNFQAESTIENNHVEKNEGIAYY